MLLSVVVISKNKGEQELNGLALKRTIKDIKCSKLFVNPAFRKFWNAKTKCVLMGFTASWNTAALAS